MKYDDMPTYENNATENEWLSVKFTQSKKIDEETKEMMENNGKVKKFFSDGVSKVKGLFAKRQKQAQVQEDLHQTVAQDLQDEQETCAPVIERKMPKMRGRLNKDKAKRIWQKSWKPAAACLVIVGVLIGMRYADAGFVGDVFGYAKDTFTSTIVAPQTEADNPNTVVMPSNAEVAITDGDITLSGGSLAVNLKAGTVTDVTETGVTVSVGDKFDIVYSNLSEVLVNVGDSVAQYHVLGKYDDSAIVNLIVDGQKLTGVSADGFTLKWQV